MSAGHGPLDLQTIIDSKSAASWPISTGEKPRRSLADAIDNRSSSIAIIGECRNLAPSYGSPAHYTINELVEFYGDHVDAVSVLTEGTHFGGQLEWLELAKKNSNLPVLCLDLVESKRAIESVHSFGADAVILIASLLKPQKLVSLCEVARDYGLETVVETGSIAEAQLALDAKADIIGINTRNIHNLSSIDADLPRRIINTLPRGTLTIAESGIRVSTDLQRYVGVADAVLIGSAFVESDDIAQTFADFDAVRINLR